jgi:flagellar biosynthesis protein FliQ
MERYLEIIKVNWKFNLLPHGVVAIVLSIISPLIMGVENLDNIQTARVLELYISLLGMVLLIPLFIPDEDKNIRDLIRSKKESMLIIYIIRLIEAIFIVTVIIGVFMIYLRTQECSFSFVPYFYGTVTNCIFLGGLGILMYSISNNLPVGYMVPVLYYMMCFGAGKKYLGNFYLFSMSSGSLIEKQYLLIAGILMIIIGILKRYYQK